MEITLTDIRRIVAQAVGAGIMEAVKRYEPLQDFVKEKDLPTWCVMNGIDRKKIHALVTRGDIKRHHLGKSPNSAIVYSKAEIQQMLLTLQIGESIGD